MNFKLQNTKQIPNPKAQIPIFRMIGILNLDVGIYFEI